MKRSSEKCIRSDIKTAAATGISGCGGIVFSVKYCCDYGNLIVQASSSPLSSSCIRVTNSFICGVSHFFI